MTGKIFVMEIKAEFGEAREIIKPCENSMKFTNRNDEVTQKYDSQEDNNSMQRSDFQSVDSEPQMPNDSEDVAIMEECEPEDNEAPSTTKKRKNAEDSELPAKKKKTEGSRSSYYRSNKHKHEITFDGPVITASHIMKYLKVFCKASPLSKSVHMFFEKVTISSCQLIVQDEPLVLSYDIRGIGTLIYCICDVSEKNDGEQADE
jgi:hypothetical protein